MAVTYQWDITKLDVWPEKNGLNDVVYNVHWNLIATDGDFTVEQNNIETIEINEDSDYQFVSFEDLTKEQVVEWVKSSLAPKKPHIGLDEFTDEAISQLDLLYEGLKSRIRELKAPPSVSPELPWL